MNFSKLRFSRPHSASDPTHSDGLLSSGWRYSMLGCLSLFSFGRLQQRRRPFHLSIPTCSVNRLNFTTSSTVQIRRRLTLRSRRICIAGGRTARLRLSQTRVRNREKTLARPESFTQWPGIYSHTSSGDVLRVSKMTSSCASLTIQGRCTRPIRNGILQKVGKQPVRTKYAWLGGWAPPLDSTGNVTPAAAHEQVSFQYDSSWAIRFHRVTEGGESVNLHLSTSRGCICLQNFV